MRNGFSQFIQEQLAAGSLPYTGLQALSGRIGEITSLLDEKEMRWLQTEARAILKTGGAFCAEGLQKVRELNQICIRKNMSPGGAADLLAATIFLCRMETLMERRKGILQ